MKFLSIGIFIICMVCIRWILKLMFGLLRGKYESMFDDWNVLVLIFIGVLELYICNKLIKFS